MYALNTYIDNILYKTIYSKTREDALLWEQDMYLMYHGHKGFHTQIIEVTPWTYPNSPDAYANEW